MQINTGNFGNNVAQLTPERTVNPEVGAVQQAQITAAQQKAQAGTNLGQAVTGIGDVLHAHYVNIAKQKAQLQLQDKQNFHQGVLDDINARVQNGELSSKDIGKAYADGMAGWKGEAIQDMDSSTQFAFDKGMASLEGQGSRQVNTLTLRTAHVENVQAADQVIAGIAAQAVKPGADIAALSKQVDDAYDQNKMLFGAATESKRMATKKALQTNYTMSLIEQNAGDPGKLNAIKQQVMSGNFDPAVQVQMVDRIDGKVNELNRRAEAAQRHADAVAERREHAAEHASDQMNNRIAAGEVPSEEDWKTYEQTTAGTSQAGSSRALQVSLNASQQIIGMPPAQAQAVIDTQRNQLRAKGGSAEDWKVVNIAQAALDKRNADLRENPQRVAENNLGQALTPVNVMAAGDAAKDPAQAKQFSDTLNQRVVNRKANITKYGPATSDALLTKEEQRDAAYTYSQMAPNQRVDWLHNLSKTTSPEIATQIAKEVQADPSIAAHVSSGTAKGLDTARKLSNGAEMMDKPNKPETKSDADLRTAIKGRYPEMSEAQIQEAVPRLRNYLLGSNKTKNDSIDKEDMAAVIGSRVKVLGVNMTAPPEKDPVTWGGKLSSAVNQLPAKDAQGMRNRIESGDYRFITDANGREVLVTSANRAVIYNGKPFVVETR